MTSVTNTNANFYDSPNSLNWATPVKLSVDPLISFPIDRDTTAQVFVESYIQNPDNYSPATIGEPHPSLTTDILGTVDIANNTSTVSGTSTQFESEFLSGDYIVLNGQKYDIDTITSDTELELVEPFLSTSLVSATAQRAKCYLTKEDGHSFEEDGLMRWSKHFATVPQSRIDYTNQNFTFPAYKNLTSDSGTTRSSFQRTVIAQQVFSYVRTNNPVSRITINPIFNITANGLEVQAVAQDTVPTLSTYQGYVTNGVLLQGQETRLSNYMGNIWQVEDVKVYAK